MPRTVSIWWNSYSITLSVITVGIYSITYVKLYCFSPFSYDTKQAEKHKTILSTQIIQVIMVFLSNVMSAATIMLMRNLHAPEQAVTDAETYAVIPGLLGYSCNFYVYFWRSREFREAFTKQLTCDCKKSKLDTTTYFTHSSRSVNTKQRFISAY
uniref:DUF4149 domain-containing protein n=1 Tax=Heterorhabditis bacteriophora TaxID=37862 RepID=A0A1I7X6R8_HETBA